MTRWILDKDSPILHEDTDHLEWAVNDTMHPWGGRILVYSDTSDLVTEVITTLNKHVTTS